MPLYPTTPALTARINRTPYRNTALGYSFEPKILNIGQQDPILRNDALTGESTGIILKQSTGFGVPWTITAPAAGLAMLGNEIVVDDIDDITTVDDFITVTVSAEGFPDFTTQLYVALGGSIGMYLMFLNNKTFNRVPV